MHAFFIKTYYFIKKNQLLSLGIAFLFLLSGAFFTSKIKFEEDITQVLPKSENADITAKVIKQLNFSDKITVLISKESKGTAVDLSQTAAQFLDSLQNCQDYIKNVQGSIGQENIQETFDFVYDHLPLFLDDEDYATIESKLIIDSIAKQVNTNYRSLIAPSGLISRDFILKDPLGLTFMALKKLQQLNIGDDFQLKNGFLTTKDGTTVLLFINPKLSGSETQQNTLFVNQLNAIQKQLNESFKDRTQISYFGSSFIAVANANQIKHDIHYTVAISMGVLMLLLILFYKKITIPVLLFLPPLFGGLSGLTVLYLLKDSISAISLGIGAVLLGVTIDYSLHILTHYKSNVSIESLYRDITKPLLISSCTTAIAFLCLVFVHSEALKDLGVFAAVSVLVSAGVSLIIIPQLYQPKVTKERKTILDRIAGFSYDSNKYIVVVVILITLIGFFFSSEVKYNTNLSELNYVPDEIKAAQNQLEATTSIASKSIYTVTYAASLEEALNKNNKLFNVLRTKKNNNEILNFSSIGGVVLSQANQLIKNKKWDLFWTKDKKQKVYNSIVSQTALIGFKPETHQQFYDLLDKKFTPISIAAYRSVGALFIDEYVSQKEGFYTLSTIVKVNEAQRSAYISSISSRPDVLPIDRQQLNETFLGKLKDDFGILINYSFIAIFIVLFIFFRRIEFVLIGALPIVITGFVIAGLLVLFGIELNIFSTIVCTLIFGHGVDFSIFMTSALIKKYTYGVDEVKTYRASILLAVLTTILAVGVLIFAKHPALLSISIVSLIGIATAVIVTFVFYPILFRICISNRPDKGKSPIGLRMFIHSTISFVYYGLGGIALSIFGQLILKLAPVKKEVKMLWFRRAMSNFMGSVLYTNPFVKKTVLNQEKEDFQKPAVIISNHTSFLDTLAVGMLSPKIIFLVNDWVYNSPVFGRAVKLAGFYPVSQGLEGGVEHLRSKVDAGYSLMVFPEGHRSLSNSMSRFHKGAFYLAEQLKLDILPVFIHGNSETLPKGDHIIYDKEQITVKIGKRIDANDESFGSNYTQRTKKISKYFKQEFADLRQSIEKDDYFDRKLLMSFMYKDRTVQKLIKTEYAVKKSIYYNLNQYIPVNEKIANWSNDCGTLDVILTLQEPKRKLFTYIGDQNNQAIAQNNYWVIKRNINYVNTIEDTLINTTTLLVNTNDEINIDVMSLDGLETIILLSNFNLKSRFISLGYKLFKEENQLLILKKK